MKRASINILLAAVLATATAPSAQAGWDNLLEDAKQLGQRAGKITKQAWEKAKEQWEKLELNYTLLQAFGDAVDEESALIGRFYDLKRPIDDKAKPLTGQGVVDIFHEFNKKKWDQDIFNAYYSPKVKLYAPYFYLPRCKASYGPEAFQCNANADKGEPIVEPTAWVVIYRGVVTAPQSGSFRFVGMGDDTLMVRFNNKLVLESGWTIPTRRGFEVGTHADYQQEITRKITNHNAAHQKEITPKTKGRAIYQYENTPHWNNRLGGLPSGVPFTVKKGEKYPIEILVSEVPGSEFGFCLLLEELDDPKNPPHGIIKKDDAPMLHLFRTSKVLPEPEKIKQALKSGGRDYSINDCREGPPFFEDSLIWKADFEEGEKRGLFSRIFGKLTGSDKDTAMGTSRKDNDEKDDDEESDKEDDDDKEGGKKDSDKKDKGDKEENILDTWRLW